MTDHAGRAGMIAAQWVLAHMLQLSDRLERYSETDRQTIADYFSVIAFTRKTRKLAIGVLRGELDYWSAYPIPVVIDALRLHMRKHASKRERYTRGIIRHANQALQAKNNGGRGTEALAGSSGGRGRYGQGDDRYIGADEPLPL